MSPSPDDESSLTIKYGGDFGAPWLVFKGHPSSIRRQLIEAFGYEEAAVEEIDLASLAAKASMDAAAMYALAGVGQPEGTGRRTSKPKGDPWAATPKKTTETAAEPQVDADTQRVLELIAAANDALELKAAWANNQESFEGNKELQSAYKARGKELKGTN